MNKEYLESLKRMAEYRFEEYGVERDDGTSFDEDFEIIKQALQRLEAIDNAKPNETLELIDSIREYSHSLTMVNYLAMNYDLDDIQEYILKAQDNEDWNTIIEEYDIKPHEVREAFIVYKMFQSFNKKVKDAEICFKALDVIKEKNVEIYWLKHSKTVEEYNKHIKNLRDTFNLTQEEFDLLKRWIR